MALSPDERMQIPGAPASEQEMPQLHCGNGCGKEVIFLCILNKSGWQSSTVKIWRNIFKIHAKKIKKSFFNLSFVLCSRIVFLLRRFDTISGAILRRRTDQLWKNRW